MDFELRNLIDLYAYKTEDILQGREPRGGRASVLHLRKYLLEAQLPGPLAKRFRELDRRFRDRQMFEGISVDEAAPPVGASQLDIDIGVVDLPIEESQTNELNELKKITLKFSEKVFWTRLKRELKRVVRGYMRGGRYELRLAYAFLQNFETYSKSPSFASDYNLSRLELVEPIPSITDPVAAIENEDVAQALILEVFKIAMDLGNLNKYSISLPPESIISYLRRFFRHIVENPQSLPIYAPGEESKIEELQAALDQARRSAMARHEREMLIRNLEDQLREAVSEEHRMRLLVEEERGRFLTAAARLTTLLQRYLPAPRGEANFPRVPDPLPVGADSGPVLPEQPENLTMITLKRVPIRFQLGGVPLIISVVGEDTQITVADEDHTLIQDEPLTIPYENWEVWAFRYQDYIHIRLEVREGAQLSQLLTEGTVLAHLVHPFRDYAYLRLLRAFAARLKGPVDYEEYGPASAKRFAEAPLDTLELFARKGLGVVKSRLQNSPGGFRLLREAAAQMDLDAEGLKLYRALSNWLNYRPPTRETLGGELGVATVTADPVNIQAGNIILSIRQADGSVYVGTAGSVPRKLEDLVVWLLEDEAIVIAREGNRVAHTNVKII